MAVIQSLGKEREGKGPVFTRGWFRFAIAAMALLTLTILRRSGPEVSFVLPGDAVLQTIAVEKKVQTYQSPFLKIYTEKEKAEMNTEVALAERKKQAKVTRPKSYYHQSMENYYFMKLVLRAMTTESLFMGTVPEPAVDKFGNRTNGGCGVKSKGCMFTWDAYGRAMGSADVFYDVLKREVPGDVVEVGVFKGGMSAYFQAMLMAAHETDKRKLWLVDSFQGLPPATMMHSKNDKSGSEFNSDMKQAHWAGELSVGVSTVYGYLDRLGLLDPGNVYHLEGFVQDSLPGWEGAQQISLLRVDVDIYSATYDALHFLYPRLSKGGAVLFDDWKFKYSAEAVVNYRNEHGITTPIQFLAGAVDPMAYWIKE